jgi:hypothetical protein
MVATDKAKLCDVLESVDVRVSVEMSKEDQLQDLKQMLVTVMLRIQDFHPNILHTGRQISYAGIEDGDVFLPACGDKHFDVDRMPEYYVKEAHKKGLRKRPKDWTAKALPSPNASFPVSIPNAPSPVPILDASTPNAPPPTKIVAKNESQVMAPIPDTPIRHAMILDARFTCYVISTPAEAPLSALA